MTNPYPLPRFLRQTAVLEGNGGAVYGPFSGFSIWDTADIEVWWRPAGQDNFTKTTATVAKTTADAFSPFTVTFPAGVPGSTQFVVLAARLHERAAGLQNGTMLDPNALEKEISRQGTILQELRREVNRAIKMAFDNSGTPYEVAPGVGFRSVLVLENGRIKIGPTVDELQDWKDRAEDAADDAEAARLEALEAAARLSALLAVLYPTRNVDVYINPLTDDGANIPVSGGYIAGQVSDVFVEGHALSPGDYLAPGGGTITLLDPLTVDDLIGDNEVIHVRIKVGSGLTFDTGALNALYAPRMTPSVAGVSGVSRPYLARPAELPWSIEEFGSYGTTLSNHTSLVAAAMASDANEILFPAGKVLNVETTIRLTTPKKIVGGFGSVLRLQRGTSHVVPLFFVVDGADGSELIGVTFDHNSESLPQASLGNQIAIAHLSAVPVMADYVSFTRCRFLNGWDNGLAIGRYGIAGDGSIGSPFWADNSERAAPIGFRVDGCYAYNCGIGNHASGPLGRIGVGINVLSGSRGTVSDCIAEYCHTGFATDFGGGAGAAFNNCIALRSRENADSNNGGLGFYLADGPVQISNCQAMFGDRVGFEIPGEANGVDMSNCRSFANGRHGFVICSSHTKLTSCVSQADSLAYPNLFDGFYFNPYFEDMIDVQLIGCSTWGETNRYGWSAQSTSPFATDIEIIGGKFSGLSAEGNKGGKTIAVISNAGGTVRLNPLGGQAEVLGAWDSPFRMNGAYLFVDDVGRLRIKTGSVPGSVTDGTIVGAQS